MLTEFKLSEGIVHKVVDRVIRLAREHRAQMDSYIQSLSVAHIIDFSWSMRESSLLAFDGVDGHIRQYHISTEYGDCPIDSDSPEQRQSHCTGLLLLFPVVDGHSGTGPVSTPYAPGHVSIH